MSAREHDHRSSLDYSSFIDALIDADRVIDDLAVIGDGQMLITATELEFTARRLRTLIAGCIRSAREAGIP